MDSDGQPEVDTFGDRLATWSLLAEMAKDPRSGLVQVEPGVYVSSPQVGHFLRY